ncbi:Na+/H+ antiporter NhaA [Streptomyces sp. NPDC046716]|uniref:Na+/H+ antiporter NhaA n=1 Tax=Streptomyces sp. NPDC046716 TaxID=3157093 RepID=UPI0033D963EA
MAFPLDDYTGRSGGSRRSPLRDFLRTETGSAAVLVAAALAALLWANTAPAAYASFWRTHLSVEAGTRGLSLSLREWINSGLMALFFFVVGLEARREFDVGELRDRRRLVLPLVAGLSGMVVPVVLFLAVNAGQPSAYGWGAAMSTDTAFALGMLAVVGRRLPSGLRVFLLTITVVDDFLSLGVIAVAYSADVDIPALLLAIAVFGGVLLARALRVRRGAVYALLAVVVWGALVKSGVDPVVVGLAMGLLTYAHPAAREDLEHATGLFRMFREQPTPERERSARAGLAYALSPNDRLQGLFHPWTSYLVVPLFALANTGIPLDAAGLGRAFTSPVTIGILLAFVVGKPLGILGASVLTYRLSSGRIRPPVGWGAVAAGGTLAGTGFTVSLLIATLAFDGTQLQDAKIGILSALVASFLTSQLVTAAISTLPNGPRQRLLFGRAETITDLVVPVDPDRDHVRGPEDATVTVVEYGDYECPYCGQAEGVVRELLGDFDDVRYVWRHLPLTDVHTHAQPAAEAAEAAASQGRFWDMHDLLFSHQGALRLDHLRRYAAELGLDMSRFDRDLRAHRGSARIAEDVESADLSGVAGTPTFFVNGHRHDGAYDISGLSAAVRAAGERAATSGNAPRGASVARNV